MGLGWSSDFSYGYFRKILRAIKSNFEPHLLSEAPQILGKSGTPKLILRHDIDVSLKRALMMAEIEKESGVHATYMVMVDSPLYSLRDRTSQSMLSQLIDMGHEIGLHFDIGEKNREGEHEIRSVEAKIYSSCKQLEKIVGLPIRSISFHFPVRQFLGGALTVCDRVNAYSRELMSWYLSDSRGCWKNGEPLPMLLKPGMPHLQLLIHPIWWGDEHMLPEDRLQDLFDTETKGQSRQYAKAFDSALMSIITDVRRRGVLNEVKGGV